MTDIKEPSRLKKGDDTVLTGKEIMDLPITQMDYSTLPDPNGQAVKMHKFVASIEALRKKKGKTSKDNS